MRQGHADVICIIFILFAPLLRGYSAPKQRSVQASRRMAANVRYFPNRGDRSRTPTIERCWIEPPEILPIHVRVDGRIFRITDTKVVEAVQKFVSSLQSLQSVFGDPEQSLILQRIREHFLYNIYQPGLAIEMANRNSSSYKNAIEAGMQRDRFNRPLTLVPCSSGLPERNPMYQHVPNDQSNYPSESIPKTNPRDNWNRKWEESNSKMHPSFVVVQNPSQEYLTNETTFYAAKTRRMEPYNVLNIDERAKQRFSQNSNGNVSFGVKYDMVLSSDSLHKKRSGKSSFSKGIIESERGRQRSAQEYENNPRIGRPTQTGNDPGRIPPIAGKYEVHTEENDNESDTPEEVTTQQDELPSLENLTPASVYRNETSKSGDLPVDKNERVLTDTLFLVVATVGCVVIAILLAFAIWLIRKETAKSK